MDREQQAWTTYTTALERLAKICRDLPNGDAELDDLVAGSRRAIHAGRAWEQFERERLAGEQESKP